jgi:hypothetical protein
MNDQFPIFSPTTSPAGASAISSQESAVGLLRCVSPDGRKTARSGRDRAPASRSPTRDKARVSTIQGTCGQTSSVSSAPDGPLSSWESKLRDRLAMVGSTECALIWREKITPAGASISRLAPWTPPTSVPVSTGSLWPTALATSSVRSLEKAQAEIDFGTQVRVQDHMVAAWPTPTAQDLAGGRSNPPGTSATGARPDGTKATVGLPGAMKGSPRATPRASDGEKGGPNQSFSAGGQPLPAQIYGAAEAQASPWATPAARDYRHPNALPLSERGGGKKGEQLPNQMAHLGSGPRPTGSSATTESRGAPNPAFPCWLMGYGAAWLLATPSVKLDRTWVQTRI